MTKDKDIETMADTSYTKEYFDIHVDKYLNRNSNHQGVKISAVKELTKNMDFETVFDFGCCIGTFALEFASVGKKAIGLDLSLYGLECAEKLAQERKVGERTNFINADASEIPLRDKSVDLVFAEDIVEHLVPHLLEKTLRECYRVLRPGGKIVIHTFPTKYSFMLDIIEHRKVLPLLYPFALLPAICIDKFLYFFDKMIFPILYRIIKGKNWREFLLKEPHCNLQTLDSLKHELVKAEFKIKSIYSTNLYKEFFPRKYFKMFAHSETSKRNLIAVAAKEA